MDNLFSSLFTSLSFFGGDSGPIIVGVATALIIVAWEWRVALIGLFCVQVGVVSASVAMGQLPSEWAGVMVVVMALACLILALSAQRMTRTTTLNQAGTWPLRTLLLVLIYIGWELAEVNLPLPMVNAQLADLFVWLALCTLVMLGLSDNPLFSTVALLMWLMPVQVVTALIVNSPALVALIGMLSLLLALAGSYLILVEQVSAEEAAPAVTDIAFPDDLRIPPPSSFQAGEDAGLMDWVRRQAWGAAAMERTRELVGRRRP
jgi:hypothetical protein